MLRRFRAAGLIWPTIMAIPVLALLLGLGHWQMSRKVWKDGLIAQIKARTSAEPQPMGGHLRLAIQKQGIEYLRVRASGRLLHGQEKHVYWPGSEGPGWLVHTPLVLDDEMVVLVNRGWVPDALKDPSRRQSGQIGGRVAVSGLVRLPEAPNRFTPANDPLRNIWFFRDLPAMLVCRNPEKSADECKAIVGVARPEVPREIEQGLPKSYPFYIDAEGEPANPGGWPRGGTTNLNLPSRHLEYALTWYGLAATLVAMWGAFAWARLREHKSD